VRRICRRWRHKCKAARYRRNSPRTRMAPERNKKACVSPLGFPPDSFRHGIFQSARRLTRPGARLVQCPRINCTVPVPGVAQATAVCRLRTVLTLGRPRKTMACPTANPLYSYFADTTLAANSCAISGAPVPGPVIRIPSAAC
jgi:hypothetical protein